jgi:hypothetical protein
MQDYNTEGENCREDAEVSGKNLTNFTLQFTPKPRVYTKFIQTLNQTYRFML